MVEVEGEAVTYHGLIIQQMLDEANFRDKNVHVIAISGVYRSGKSFLLNLLYTYLQYYERVKATYFTITIKVAIEWFLTL